MANESSLIFGSSIASSSYDRTRNFSGVILDHGEFGVEIRRDDNGELERLIVDAEDLEEADEGEYWLRTTGASVLQPDLIAEWVHYDERPGHATLKLEAG